MRPRDARRLLDEAKRTGVLPMIAEADMPLVRSVAREMGVRQEAEPIERTAGGCMRVAVSEVYSIPYAGTPT